MSDLLMDQHPRPDPRQRGQKQVDVFYDAMLHELKCNAHKGDWLTDEVTDAPRGNRQMVADLLYHAAKLYAAVMANERPAALEYAADVGNCAWFVADKMQALDTALLTEGPVEYDPDGDPVLTPAGFAAMKAACHGWADQIAEAVRYDREHRVEKTAGKTETPT